MEDERKANLSGTEFQASGKMAEEIVPLKTTMKLFNKETGEETISPIVACYKGIKHVLVFNSEDNLAEYSKKVVPYAALSGRVIVDMLARANLGIIFNFAIASSELVLTAGKSHG